MIEENLFESFHENLKALKALKVEQLFNKKIRKTLDSARKPQNTQLTSQKLMEMSTNRMVFAAKSDWSLKGFCRNSVLFALRDQMLMNLGDNGDKFQCFYVQNTSKF